MIPLTNLNNFWKKKLAKINDELDGKVHQFCQDKTLLQEQVSEFKKRQINYWLLEMIDQ